MVDGLELIGGGVLKGRLISESDANPIYDIVFKFPKEKLRFK